MDPSEQFIRLHIDSTHNDAFTASVSIVSLFALILALAAFLFWLWMLIDCLRKEHSQPNDKLIWMLVIVFNNCIGALIYFFVGRPRTRQTTPGEPRRTGYMQ